MGNAKLSIGVYKCIEERGGVLLGANASRGDARTCSWLVSIHLIRPGNTLLDTYFMCVQGCTDV